MTIEIDVIDNGKGIDIRCFDVIHGSDVIALQKPEQPVDFTNILYLCIDYSNVRASYISLDELRIIAKNDHDMLNANPNLFVAAIVPNELFRSISNLWRIYAEPVSPRIKNFQTREDAQEWISQMIKD